METIIIVINAFNSLFNQLANAEIQSLIREANNHVTKGYWSNDDQPRGEQRGISDVITPVTTPDAIVRSSRQQVTMEVATQDEFQGLMMRKHEMKAN